MSGKRPRGCSSMRGRPHGKAAGSCSWAVAWRFGLGLAAMALCLGAALLVGAAVLHLKIIRTHIAAWPRDWSPGVPEHAATLPRGGVPGETWAGLAARKKLVLLGAMRRQQAGATAAAGAAQAAADAAAPRGGTGRGAAGAGRAAPWPPYGAARPLEEYEALAARGPHPIRLKYPMIWCSAFWSRSGYGNEAVSFIAGLLQANLVHRDDVWIAQSGDHVHAAIVQGMEPSTRTLLQEQDFRNITQRLPPSSRNRPLISICHSFPDCWRAPKDDSWSTPRHYTRALEVFWKRHVLRRNVLDSGCPCPNHVLHTRVAYRVARSMFETETLPPALAWFAHHVDEVWTPSQFNVESFARGGVPLEKLSTLAQGVNTTMFNPDLALKPMDLSQGTLVFGTQYTGTARPFRFLSVFKWEARKGWDILLQAFAEEFRGQDDVELHIVAKMPTEVPNSLGPEFIRASAAPLLNISGAGNRGGRAMPRVYTHHEFIPDSLYPGLYRAADALVIPTHGEGWGRPQIEAMSMGMPVISTNWSGLTAFMNERVAYPIRVEAVVAVDPLTQGDFDWFKGQRWALPSMGHLRQLMREVLTDPAAAAAKGAAARAHVLRHFSLEVVSRQLLAHLLRLQDTVDHILGAPDVLPISSPSAEPHPAANANRARSKPRRMRAGRPGGQREGKGAEDGQ